MRPTPISDDEVWGGATRIVVAPPSGDLTDTEIGAVEALVDLTNLGKRFSMRCIPEGDEADRIQRGAPVWVEFLGEQLHPFLVEIGQPPADAPQQLRLEVDMSSPVPEFACLVQGVDQDEVGLFVAGCIEALQKMVESGLTPPDPT